ncbi:mRNA splicing protein [Coemansia sp. RSA 2708]|nr:mRNA splicing protein [Coemansia sp. RSA 2708]
MSSGAYGSGRLSREDYKRQKDLEAARKAGTAAPERDAEGNEINPHIPEFMSKAPWYLDTGKAGLQHQRKAAQAPSSSSSWYRRGERVGAAPTKFRKGACTNCGAMSHKTKDCMERPRKKGAKWTGTGMMADERVERVELAYDAKRDAWNGYDAAEHKKLMADWELVEEARRKRKATELDRPGADTAGGNIEDQFASSDEDVSADNDDRPAGRNLRIREDTAKYLRNLDPDSAYYDPKTRSMRENPYAGTQQTAYAGDNFIRYSGEAQEVLKREVFAWEAGERGNTSAHSQANPTQTALMYKQFTDRRHEGKSSRQQQLLAQYGGEEHLQAPPQELLQQSEGYVEYSRTGEVVRGREQAARSKYREDVHPLNHSSVFGSWWSDGQWGYRCCRQTMKNAYCIGAMAPE